MTQTSPSADAIASSSECEATAPGADQSCWRGGTTFRRPGSGRTDAGNESQVVRPMTTVAPIVSCLNSCWSSGSRQGKAPSRPMTRSAASAQMSETVTRPRSDGDRSAQRRMVLVADDGDVVVGVVEQGVGVAQLEAWEVIGRPRQLRAHLLDVVVVDVTVAAGPDELAHLEPDLLSDHVRQQRVARDVERHTEEEVGAALVELAGQPAVGDVELEEGVARRQRHLWDVADVEREEGGPRCHPSLGDAAEVPGGDEDRSGAGAAPKRLEQRGARVEVPAVRRRPAPPLNAVDGAEVAVRLGPLVPDRHAVL